MKLSKLLQLFEASLERWGDIDCFVHSDTDAEHFIKIEDVIGEYLEHEECPILVLTAYETRPKLKLVAR